MTSTTISTAMIIITAALFGPVCCHMVECPWCGSRSSCLKTLREYVWSYSQGIFPILVIELIHDVQEQDEICLSRADISSSEKGSRPQPRSPRPENSAGNKRLPRLV